MTSYPWEDITGAEYPFDIFKAEIEAIPKGGFK